MKTIKESYNKLKSITYTNTCYSDKDIKSMQKTGKKIITLLYGLNGNTFCNIDKKKEFKVDINHLIIGHNSLTIKFNKNVIKSKSLLSTFYPKVSGDGYGTGLWISYE